jgi:hypothetical protein
MHSGSTVIRGHCWVAIVILNGFFCISTTRSAEDTGSFWHVVILHGADMSPPVTFTIEKAACETLLAGTTQKIEFDTEPLDALSMQDATIEPALVEFLQKKYEGREPEIFIVIGEVAFDFVLRHRLELWPETPVVLCGVPKDLVRDHDLGPNVTGIYPDFDWASTLDLATHLQPSAHRVFLVAGTADTDQSLLHRAKEVFAHYHHSLEVTYLTGQSVPQLIESVRRLSPDSIVLYTSVFRDPTGRRLVPRDVLKQLAEASGAPIYGVAETYLGYGIVGGAISDFAVQGRLLEAAATTAFASFTQRKPRWFTSCRLVSDRISSYPQVSIPTI